MEENLARLGIPVSAYEDSEISQVAAMLGANRVPGEDDAPGEVNVDMNDFRA